MTASDPDPRRRKCRERILGESPFRDGERRWERWIPPVLLGLGVVFFWEGSVRGLRMDSFVLPSPTRILGALWSDWVTLQNQAITTLGVALAGFFLALLLGVVGGSLMGRFPLLKRAIYPFAVMSQGVPIVFVYPLFLIWFGFGVLSKIIVVTLICFFPMLVGLSDGIGQTDQKLIGLFRTMGAGKWRLLLTIQIPSALPRFFSGAKVSATYCIVGAVIGEWLGAKSGMGVYMIRSYRSFETTKVFAAIVVVLGLSLLLFHAVHLIEKGVIRWRPEREE